MAGSDPSPFGDPEGSDPFGGVPFLGDLMKMLGAQGGFRWEQAMQVAFQLATEGRSEPNPATRKSACSSKVVCARGQPRR